MNNPKPWETEPSYLKYRDAATGLLCVIRRTDMGHLCGYVRLPHGRIRLQRHTWHWNGRNRTAWDMPGQNRIKVHGGITFTSNSGLRRPTGGTLDGRWVGFDCAHADDLVPGMAALVPSLERGTYRDISFVKQELARLAKQIARKGK